MTVARENIGARILRSSALYMLASGGSGIIALLLLPILTRLLTPADFGILGILTATLGFLTALIGFNPSLMVTARYAVLSREGLRDIVSASAPLVIIMAVVAAVLLEVADSWLSGGDLPAWTVLALATAGALSVFRVLGLTLFQMRHQSARYAAIEMGVAILSGGLALALVWGFNLDWRGKFLADVAGITVIGIGMLILLAREGLIGPTSPAAVRSFLRYSAPLGVHAVAFWAINAQDRYFVAALDSVSAAGVYTVAYTVGAALGLVHTALLRAFNPHFYAQARLGEAERGEIVRITYAYLIASVVLWLLFLAAAYAGLPIYLGPQFEGSFVLISWVSLGYTFNALRNVMTGYLYLAERTHLISALTVAGALLNAILNVLLIPVLQGVGAALATAITFAVVALLTTWFAVRLHPMPWRGALRPRPGTY